MYKKDASSQNAMKADVHAAVDMLILITINYKIDSPIYYVIYILNVYHNIFVPFFCI